MSYTEIQADFSRKFSLADSDLTSAEKAVLRLHVCDTSYDFSEAIRPNSTHTYRWVDTLDWSSETSRTLHLSLPANSDATGKPTISGTAKVARKLTATKGTIADADGVPAESSFTYQWIRVDGANETDISGATSSTYTLTAADLGKKIKVKVSFTDDFGVKETRTSDAYPPADTVDAACEAPSFGSRRNIWTGTVTVGTQTNGENSLYGFTNTIGGFDGKEFTLGSNDYEIDGTSFYTTGGVGDLRFSLKDSDLTTAERAALRLHVCNLPYDFSAAQRDGGDHTYSWTADLNWSGVITRTLYLSVPANNTATGKPTISGTAKVAQKLTATKGTIADADGVPAESTFTYQWVRVDGANESDISGATSSTYRLTAADAGKKVKVKVSFTDDLSGKETRTSDAYPADSTIAVTTCTEPSFGTRRNILTGIVTIGTQTFNGADIGEGFSNMVGDLDDTEFTVGSNDYEIDGVYVTRFPGVAGDLQFSLTDSDLTSAEKAVLRLHVCDTSYDFSEAIEPNSIHTYRWVDTLDWSSETSRTLYLSLPANNAATGKPGITGTAKVPWTLTATKGTIADADGLPADSTFTYQWVRVDGANETDISGATSSTYRLTAADGGKKVKVKVSFTDDFGIKETRTSDAYPATDTVAVDCATPNFGTRRHIWTGIATMGTQTFSGADLGEGFSNMVGDLDDKDFTIVSNNYEIDGVYVTRFPGVAGDLQFSLADSDLTSAEKAVLRLHVCDTSYDFSEAIGPNSTHTYRWVDTLDWSSETSRTLHLSLSANSDATGKPTISGTANALSTLTATKGTIADTDGVPAESAFTYQWIRVDGTNETDIPGATSSTYTLVDADLGKMIKGSSQGLFVELL